MGFGGDMSLHPNPTVPVGASPPQTQHSMKTFFRNEGKIKTLSDKRKARIGSLIFSLKDGFRMKSKQKEIVIEGGLEL